MTGDPPGRAVQIQNITEHQILLHYCIIVRRETRASAHSPGDPPGRVVQIPNITEHQILLHFCIIVGERHASPVFALSYWEFSELLGERQITRHYTQVDLDEDILYALGD